MFLVNAGGKITLVDARPGTPAAAAGLSKGDVITSIDGRPASAMTLDAVRQYFMQPAGTVLKVGVTSKSGTARTVSLTLRDYV
jgi:C-terminal processing protease CtpA/Prc